MAIKISFSLIDCYDHGTPFHMPNRAVINEAPSGKRLNNRKLAPSDQCKNSVPDDAVFQRVVLPFTATGENR
jgi:hypothetical protein